MWLDDFTASRYRLAVAVGVILAAGVGQLRAADRPIKTLAICEVGAVRAPAAFIDLLSHRLAADGRFSLVERDRVQLLFNEQGVNLALGEAGSDSAVRAGRLIAADALVMIEGGSRDESGTPLRLRLVETRHGLKLWDTAVMLGGEQTYEEQGRRLAESISARLSRHGGDADGLSVTAVSVAAFRSRELSPRWDWLCESLPAGLEARLSAEPGIVLLERQRTAPLIDERRLAEGLPKSLRPSLVLVDGEFEIDRTRVPQAVRVTLYCRTPAQLSQRRVEGVLGDEQALHAAIFQALSEITGAIADAQPFDARAEAEILVARAAAYQKLDMHDRAIPPLFAALALDPDAVEPKAQMIYAARFQFGDWFSGARGLNEAQQAEYQARVVPLYFYCIELATKLADYEDYPAGPAKSWDTYLKRGHLLGAARAPLGFPVRVLGALGDTPEAAGILRAMRPGLRTLAERVLSKSRELRGGFSDDLYRSALASAIAGAVWWADSPEEYFRLVRGWLNESDQEGFCAPSSFDAFSWYWVQRVPWWRDRDDLPAAYLGFLRQLSKSDRPLHRAAAELALVEYYGKSTPPDQERARTHFRKMVDVLLLDVLPRYPAMEGHIPRWVSTADPNFGLHLTPADAGEIFRRVIEAGYLPGLKSEPSSWDYLISEAVENLERAGRVAEADAILDGCIAAVPKHASKYRHYQCIQQFTSWKFALRQRHPDIFTEDQRLVVEPIEVKEIVSAAGIAKLTAGKDGTVGTIHLHRLIVRGNAVWAVGRGSWNDRRVVLVRVDLSKMATGALSTFVPVPRPPPITPGRRLPPFCFDGQDIFVAYPDTGIVRLRADGEVAAISEGDGLISSRVTSIDALGGKLYATVGYSHSDTALLEIDFERRTSRTLISARRDPPQVVPLDGSELVAVYADEERGRLLIAASNGAYGLFAFDPESASCEQLVRHLNMLHEARMARAGQEIEMQTASHWGLFNPTANTLTWQFSGDSNIERPRGVTWAVPMRAWQWARWGDDLICLGRRPGDQNTRLYRFNPGESQPRILEPKGIPARQVLRDTAVVDGQLVVLTPDGVFVGR